MMTDELVTCEVAMLAKEKGFSLHTDWSKCDTWDFPTQSLLQRWLRKEKGYYVYPFFDNESKRWTWVCRERTGDMWIQLLDFEERYSDTYELALEDALKFVLEKLI